MILILDDDMTNFYKNKCPLSVNYYKMTLEELIKESNLKMIQKRICDYVKNLEIIIDEENKNCLINVEDTNFQVLNLARIDKNFLPKNVLNIYILSLLKEYYEGPINRYKRYYSRLCPREIGYDHEYHILNYLITYSSIDDDSIEDVGYNLINYCGRKSDFYFRSDIDMHFQCVKNFIEHHNLYCNKKLKSLLLTHIMKTTKIPYLNFTKKDAEERCDWYFTFHILKWGEDNFDF